MSEFPQREQSALLLAVLVRGVLPILVILSDLVVGVLIHHALYDLHSARDLCQIVRLRLHHRQLLLHLLLRASAERGLLLLRLLLLLLEVLLVVIENVPLRDVGGEDRSGRWLRGISTILRKEKNEQIVGWKKATDSKDFSSNL